MQVHCMLISTCNFSESHKPYDFSTPNRFDFIQSNIKEATKYHKKHSLENMNES